MNIYRGRNKKDFALASALYDAISDNDFSGTKYILIDKGADPNIVLPNSGLSPFHLIIGNDNGDFAYQITNLILQNGGNPNIQSDEGLTPLHIAAAWDRLDIIKLLISCGADSEIEDSNWFTCLDYAIEYHHYETEMFLRSVMYNNITWNNEDKENYVLVLDKIIIRNGCTEGEYEVNGEKENSCDVNSSLLNKLQRLPQATSIEYVQHWRSQHAIEDNSADLFTSDNSTNSELDIAVIPNTPDTHNSYSPSSSSCKSKKRVINKNVTENFSLEYEPSIKYLLKRSEKAGGGDVNNFSSSFSKLSEFSRESGIVTLPNTISDRSSIPCKDITNVSNSRIERVQLKEVNSTKPQDTSSDYFTCTEIETSGSLNTLDKNIFGSSFVSSNARTNSSGLSTKKPSKVIIDSREPSKVLSEQAICCGVELTDDESFLGSITEVYKYVDNTEGIVLFEKRLLKNKNSEDNDANISSVQSQSSKLSTLPPNFDYDTDTLRKELTGCGYEPGPIVPTTKRIYLKKLRSLQKGLNRPRITIEEERKVYSAELEKTIENSTWCDNLTEYKAFEELVFQEFSNPNPSKKWREGTNKSSFTYLLLDPRITKNLPVRSENMTPSEVWSTFISSIFYVGKGKRSRPYSHLYNAVLNWKEGKQKNPNKKLQHIINIWNDDSGVVCLHVFQNVIPVEAYTREAAMIQALKVDNLKNLKSGDFYGIASTWSIHQQRMLGVYLLYKAMLIFLHEGERQLRPADIN